MPNPITLKLEQFADLSDSERAWLDAVAGDRPTEFRPHEDIAREGEPPSGTFVLLSGWACRYKLMRDGRRPILAFLLPGDICDHAAHHIESRDHSIAAITHVTVATVSCEALRAVRCEHQGIAEALSKDSVVDLAIQREWTVNLGQRAALERTAHLLCETFHRLRAIGRTAVDRCDLPLTQSDLADAVGLTSVHVNRTLQELRARGLIALKGKSLSIPRLSALEAVCQFDANYLHRGAEPRRPSLFAE